MCIIANIYLPIWFPLKFIVFYCTHLKTSEEEAHSLHQVVQGVHDTKRMPSARRQPASKMEQVLSLGSICTTNTFSFGQTQEWQNSWQKKSNWPGLVPNGLCPLAQHAPSLPFMLTVCLAPCESLSEHYFVWPLQPPSMGGSRSIATLQIKIIKPLSCYVIHPQSHPARKQHK